MTPTMNWNFWMQLHAHFKCRMVSWTIPAAWNMEVEVMVGAVSLGDKFLNLLNRIGRIRIALVKSRFIDTFEPTQIKAEEFPSEYNQWSTRNYNDSSRTTS